MTWIVSHLHKPTNKQTSKKSCLSKQQTQIYGIFVFCSTKQTNKKKPEKSVLVESSPQCRPGIQPPHASPHLEQPDHQHDHYDKDDLYDGDDVD